MKYKEIKYKGYIICPDNTGYVNYEFYKIDAYRIAGHGETIQDCKEQIDELLEQ